MNRISLHSEYLVSLWRYLYLALCVMYGDIDDMHERCWKALLEFWKLEDNALQSCIHLASQSTIVLSPNDSPFSHHQSSMYV
jgi:hypothetical protein